MADLSGFTIRNAFSAPQRRVLELFVDGRLGYVRPSDEWMDLDRVLPDELALAADALVAAGLLPEFEAVARG